MLEDYFTNKGRSERHIQQHTLYEGHQFLIFELGTIFVFHKSLLLDSVYLQKLLREKCVVTAGFE